MYTLILIAYLLGSINSAIIVCRLFHLPSPRSVGSGNPGATNVLRLGNKTAAGCTLLGDVLKGVVPVLIGHLFHLPFASLAWIAVAAVLGHVFPLYFGFKGGKGVATAMGCLFTIHFLLGLSVGVIWLIAAICFRFSSLASIIALITAPIFGVFFLGHASLVPLILMTLLILYRHKTNLHHLVQGTESKIGAKSKCK